MLKVKKFDAHHKALMSNLTPSLAKDLRVNNARKGKFDKFWNIASKAIEEITAVTITDMGKLTSQVSSK